MKTALRDFPDVYELQVGPTRGDRAIDRIFSNIVSSAAGTLPPLETDRDPETGRKKLSDHRIAYGTLVMERAPKTEYLTYSYRYYNPESENLFGQWLAGMSWGDLIASGDSNTRANIYQQEMNDALERFFPPVSYTHLTLPTTPYV